MPKIARLDDKRCMTMIRGSKHLKSILSLVLAVAAPFLAEAWTVVPSHGTGSTTCSVPRPHSWFLFRQERRALSWEQSTAFRNRRLSSSSLSRHHATILSSSLSSSASAIHSPSKRVKQQQPQSRSKFAQPAHTQQKQQQKQRSKFAQPAHTPHRRRRPPLPEEGSLDNDDNNNNNNNNNRQTTRHRASTKNHDRYNGDSILSSRHKERLQTAGRIGTKRYRDPRKVFVGNLPLSQTNSTHFGLWIAKEMGLPPMMIRQATIVKDWKTLTSKGYGFVDFLEPMHATVCMETYKNRLVWEGRTLTLAPGRKQPKDPIVYMKKDKNVAKVPPPPPPPMNPMEAIMLRRLDPDLADDPFAPPASTPTPSSQKASSTTKVKRETSPKVMDDGDDLDALFEDNNDDDDSLFDDDEADYDDDEEWLDEDGILSSSEYDDDDGDEEEPMNRQRRREAARKRKKRKLPHKGFG